MHRIGVKAAGLIKVNKRPAPSMLLNEMIQAVTVVPRFAPIISGMDWVSAIIPVLTKLSTITLVAVED